MPIRRFLRVALPLLAAAVIARAEKPFSFADTPGQLPKTVIPRHYALRLQPDLDTRTTAGQARIDLEVTQPVHEIVLNALGLDVTAAWITTGAPASFPRSLPTQVDAKQQTLTVALPGTLPAGSYTLVLLFRGRIGTQAEGFFVDKYPTPSGEKLMLGTQFEPTDARRVFPCWDEPVYRATYDITLVVREKFMAVGNMPATGEKSLGDGWKEVTFARTPAMPSYLVALYAGEFESVEGEQDGVKLRILTTEGKRANATYALEATKRILAYYHAYFGVPYPLPKLDQVAVPNAFATFGAMENWGLISYIDTALLFDPAASSQTRRESVFTTVAHEIAHQWFGNLVTMAWWDNLWLNEGFASWMGTKCSDALNPDWQLWLRANEDKDRAMALDARKTTHPVQRPIANESQATDAFDVISYQKGQSFLRMLEAYLGEDTFRAGIRRYVAQHKYSNTTTADLWTALGDASGKPVVAIAANWTEQPGFPVVLASASGRGADRTVQLEQVRFTLNDPGAAPLAWKIPVTVANTADLRHGSVVLLERASATLPWPGGGGTLKLNVGNAGYYRVRYDDALAEALTQQIATLPVADQLNLLSDTWALVEAGRLPAPTWLALAERLGASSSAPVVANLAGNLAFIDTLQIAQPGRRAFQAWIGQLMGPQLARLGWEAKPGESPLDGSLRGELVRLLGAAGDRAVIAECAKRFDAYCADPKSLPGNLRSPVLSVVGQYATRETYDRLHALAKSALTTEEKRRLYEAMRAARDPALARETLALSLGGELSTTEATRNVAGVASNEHAALAWDYAQANLAALLKQTTFFGRNRYVADIMRPFTDAARADELEAYVKKNLPPEALAETLKASDRIRHFAAVKQRELPAIDAWVKTRVKNPEL